MSANQHNDPRCPASAQHPLTHGRADPGSPAPSRRHQRRHHLGRDRRRVRGRGPDRVRPRVRAHVCRRRAPLRDRRARRLAGRRMRGVHGPPRRHAGVAAGRQRVSAEPAAHDRPIPPAPGPVRIVPGGVRGRRARPDRRRRGRPRGVCPTDGDAPARGVAHGPVHARRPGLRRRALAAHPRMARRPSRHDQAAVHAGRELRGVHPPVPGGVERPGRPLAALGRAELDDLRRPRRPGRLEHVRARGATRCRRRAGGRSGSPAP